MGKLPNISNEQEKQDIIAYLTTKSFSSAYTSSQTKKLRRKAKSFKILDGLLFVCEGVEKRKFYCSFEVREINEVIKSHHLPGHIGINALREQIIRNYSGISTNAIKSYVKACVECQRELIPAPNIPLTSIVPSYIRERLMVDTVDLTEYAHSNDQKKYIFTFIDSFF
ncbi:hypothetical protein CDIK_4431 [Cucumispora dikerogammari]|nr:hypothetical protein CDIK_4431 [Cucumispora dikerogammari]